MTESSHNPTGVKAILGVCAHRQRLFALGKMIPTLLYTVFGKKYLPHLLQLLLPGVAVRLLLENILPQKY